MCVCVCVCISVRLVVVVKGVPNSEHSINTPLISQQYILNSDELISLGGGGSGGGGVAVAGKDEVHWVQNSNKEGTG